MEHQYFVTEDIPEIAALDRRLPSVADRDAEYYLRQEGQGLLVGAYEKDGKFWAEDGTPLDFGHELLADDLDRIEENMVRACERLPVLESAGIKRVINGPMIWSPDSAALIGPVPEIPNYFCCTGVIPGFSQSGGLGLAMAQWIVEGEPEFDLFALDLARYDNWATKAFTRARALDCYSHRYRIHFPYEEREAGRPARTRPVYQSQKEAGAVFGVNYGWEHPLWFTSSDDAIENEQDVERTGFERQGWFTSVARECAALRRDVGLIDISNFAKYEIRGPGAREWLDLLVANNVPKTPGRTCLTPMLGVRGGIAGDFTITCIDDDWYWMIGSGAAERYHRRFFGAVPVPAGTSFQSLTESYTGFNVAGPQSRHLLQRLSNEDLSNENFPFMHSRRLTIAGMEVLALRVSFTGDLGWELYTPVANQLKLFTTLMSAGKVVGICPVGGRSLLSLRVEKGYGSWGREFSPEYWPHEVGLDRLIKMEKSDFLGRDAWLDVMSKPPREILVNLVIKDASADAWGGEPIFSLEGDPVGRISSGAYSHSADVSVALGFIDAGFIDAGFMDAGKKEHDVDIAILGTPHRARVLSAPVFDPAGARLRC